MLLPLRRVLLDVFFLLQVHQAGLFLDPVGLLLRLLVAHALRRPGQRLLHYRRGVAAGVVTGLGWASPGTTVSGDWHY